MRNRRRTPPRRHAQQGVVVLMFALSLTMLLGVAGLVLDGARLYINKAELQNAADACALAAAQELSVAPLTVLHFTRAQDAGVLAATRHRSDLQRQAVTAANVTVRFASMANAAVWNLTGVALPIDAVARCTVTSPTLALWLMPVLGIADAKVQAVAAASRQLLGTNCAPGPAECALVSSLLR